MTHAFPTRPALLGATAAALLAGCASTPPPPTAELEAARQSIANAEQVRAAEHAAAELIEARRKLDDAEAAEARGDMLAARQLAEESDALADLAFARAELEDARRVNAEIVRTTEVLREEMQRNARENRHDQ